MTNSEIKAVVAWFLDGVKIWDSSFEKSLLQNTNHLRNHLIQSNDPVTVLLAEDKLTDFDVFKHC